MSTEQNACVPDAEQAKYSLSGAVGASSGSVRLYRRRSIHGHDEQGFASDLPVRYDAVMRVASVAMP